MSILHEAQEQFRAACARRKAAMTPKARAQSDRNRQYEELAAQAYARAFEARGLRPQPVMSLWRPGQ